mgnify:CR=1 FL=1
MESYFQIREKIEINSNYHDKIIEDLKNNLTKKIFKNKYTRWH